jgi:hypothetical protein
MDLVLVRISSRSGEMLANMRLLMGRSNLRKESNDATEPESMDDVDELESAEHLPSLRISSVGMFFGIDIVNLAQIMNECG